MFYGSNDPTNSVKVLKEVMVLLRRKLKQRLTATVIRIRWQESRDVIFTSHCCCCQRRTTASRL